MNNIKKLALAVVAVAGLSGCASTQIAELSRNDDSQANAAEQKVIRALPSYGSMGGYRYRRFVAVSIQG